MKAPIPIPTLRMPTSNTNPAGLTYPISAPITNIRNTHPAFYHIVLSLQTPQQYPDDPIVMLGNKHLAISGSGENGGLELWPCRRILASKGARGRRALTVRPISIKNALIGTYDNVVRNHTLPMA